MSKPLQTVLIVIILVGLGFGLSYLLRPNDTFIEDRKESFEAYKDSLNRINDSLRADIYIAVQKNDSLILVNDSISQKILTLNSSINELRRKHYADISDIDIISLDSNIVLLAKFLSKKDSN